MKKFKIAVCQNKPLREKQKSLERVTEMIDSACENSVSLVMLPEIFYHPYELAEIPPLTEENRETVTALSELASKKGIYLCTGSTAEMIDGRRYNMSFLINPDGQVVHKHAKCHLFDVNFKDLKVKESAVFTPGEQLSIVDTDLGKIGMIICYDIRFPEAARKLALAGAEMLLVPAAFNTVTGPAHWHILFRARAIENQLYLAAASPARDENALYQAYGHSLVTDPWGEIIAEAGTEEEVIYAEIDPEKMADVRSRLPLLKHRRPELY